MMMVPRGASDRKHLRGNSAFTAAGSLWLMLEMKIASAGPGSSPAR